MSKLIKIRKPRVSLGTRGFKVTRPSARIGGRVGLNISSRGVRASVQTGRRRKKSGCSSLLTLLLFIFSIAIVAPAIVFASSTGVEIGYSQFLPIVMKQTVNTPTPTATPAPTAIPTLGVPDIQVDIIEIFYNGSGTTEPDEYVEFKNIGNSTIQLEGWTLRDNAGHTYVFPNYSMMPNQVCRVYTNQIHPEWCGFNFGSSSAIWNNSGDCAYLYDASANLLDQFCY